MEAAISNLLGLDPTAFAGARWSDLSIRWVEFLPGAMVEQTPTRSFTHHA
jgi:hypothetical protein